MPFMALTESIRLLKQKIPPIKKSEDRAILLTCIAIALVFWVLVKLSQTYRTVWEVGLEFRIPDKKAMISPPPRRLEVEIEGTGWELMYEYLIHGVPHLTYDLNVATDQFVNRGQLRNDIMRQMAAADIKVIEVNFDQISLELEDKISRKIPIRLSSALEFAPEYALQTPPVLQPDSVTVSGPATLIGTYFEWPTDTLRLTNLQAPKTVNVKLALPPQGVQLDISTSSVSLEVEQFTEKSVFVPLTVKNGRDSLKFFPDRFKLTCVVGLSRYNELTANNFTLEVDLKDIQLNESDNSMPVVLTRKPDFVRNIHFTPASVEFFILK